MKIGSVSESKVESINSRFRSPVSPLEASIIQSSLYAADDNHAGALRYGDDVVPKINETSQRMASMTHVVQGNAKRRRDVKG